MNRTILIAEDEAITAMLIRTILNHAGYSVIKSVPTGEGAVKYAAELEPGMVIMDIRLAGKMNGIEAVREIRKSSDVPVIFMSGYSDESIITEARLFNPVAYIIKPVIAEDLISILNNYFKKNKIPMVKHTGN